MRLLVLSYPKISKKNYEFIQKIRQEFDPHFEFVEPHFTLIFSIYDTNTDIFIKEISNLTNTVSTINFQIKSAIINYNPQNETYYALLVPDQGFSNIIKLHESLYSNFFEKYLDLKWQFIPHITIASSQNQNIIKNICQEFNKKNMIISGKVNNLSITTVENKYMKSVAEIKLITKT